MITNIKVILNILDNIEVETRLILSSILYKKNLIVPIHAHAIVYIIVKI